MVLIFSVEGEYIRHFGGSGSKQGMFDRPTGLTHCAHNNDLLICDLNNHRVQAYTWESKFLSQISFLRYPQDVKIHKGLIFILDKGNPFHVCNFDFSSCMGVQAQFNDPSYAIFQIGLALFFDIDDDGNICICDYLKHRVMSISFSGELIHCIGSFGDNPGQFIKPKAIALNDKYQISVLCNKVVGLLQIF